MLDEVLVDRVNYDVVETRGAPKILRNDQVYTRTSYESDQLS